MAIMNQGTAERAVRFADRKGRPGLTAVGHAGRAGANTERKAAVLWARGRATDCELRARHGRRARARAIPS
jgi:hypothetical protein